MTTRTLTKIWLILSQLAALASMIPWLGMGLMSFMAFDQGFSLPTGISVFAIWLYPLLPILCAIFAWHAFRREQYKPAAIWSGIPLLIILIVSLIFILS